MTRKTRVVLQTDDDDRLQAEVGVDSVTFQELRSGAWVSVPIEFFVEVVDTVIEVTGDDTYANLESELRSERARCAVAEAQVRALESQLTAMRALLQPKPVKSPEMED